MTSTSRRSGLRQLLWIVHRWIALTLLVLLVPIAVSGALLVYHDELDALINPQRWAVSGPELALTPTLRNADHDLVTVTVDDLGGAARRLPDLLAGNRAAQWIRWIHDGSRGGSHWQFIVFLTGVFPAIFAVTGLLMWWRGRRARRRIVDAPAIRDEKLVAAE